MIQRRFTSGTVAIYLGCDLATDCDLATLTTSDAVFTLPGRLLNGVNVWQLPPEKR